MGPDGTATGRVARVRGLRAGSGAGRRSASAAWESRRGGSRSPGPRLSSGKWTRIKVAGGALRIARSHGITTMVNMDGNRYTCVLLAEMEAEGRLTARVKVPFHMKPHMDLDGAGAGQRDDGGVHR